MGFLDVLGGLMGTALKNQMEKTGNARSRSMGMTDKQLERAASGKSMSTTSFEKAAAREELKYRNQQ